MYVLCFPAPRTICLFFVSFFQFPCYAIWCFPTLCDSALYLIFSNFVWLSALFDCFPMLVTESGSMSDASVKTGEESNLFCFGRSQDGQTGRIYCRYQCFNAMKEDGTGPERLGGSNRKLIQQYPMSQVRSMWNTTMWRWPWSPRLFASLGKSGSSGFHVVPVIPWRSITR